MKSNFSFQPSFFNLFSLQVHLFLFGRLFFWDFWNWRCTCVGIFSLSQSDSRIHFYFKFVIILAPNLSRLSLVDFFDASTCDDESPLEVRENSERKCPPLKPTVALFSMVTLLLATGDSFNWDLSYGSWFSKKLE